MAFLLLTRLVPPLMTFYGQYTGLVCTFRCATEVLGALFITSHWARREWNWNLPSQVSDGNVSTVLSIYAAKAFSDVQIALWLSERLAMLNSSIRAY